MLIEANMEHYDIYKIKSNTMIICYMCFVRARISQHKRIPVDLITDWIMTHELDETHIAMKRRCIKDPTYGELLKKRKKAWYPGMGKE